MCCAAILDEVFEKVGGKLAMVGNLVKILRNCCVMGKGEGKLLSIVNI